MIHCNFPTCSDSHWYHCTIKTERSSGETDLWPTPASVIEEIDGVIGLLGVNGMKTGGGAEVDLFVIKLNIINKTYDVITLPLLTLIYRSMVFPP